jgi:hypothetical protein
MQYAGSLEMDSRTRENHTSRYRRQEPLCCATVQQTWLRSSSPIKRLMNGGHATTGTGPALRQLGKFPILMVSRIPQTLVAEYVDEA